MKKIIYFLAAAFFAVSCGSASKITRAEQYPGMYEEKPVVLLVMPPINKTTNVDAKDLLYTSISRPLAEAGYYVISPFLAMDILRNESAYDAELFVDAPLTTFRNFFDCDAVVFSEISHWEKVGFGIQAGIRYFIRSAKTGEVIFDRNCDLYLDLSVSSNSNDSALVSLVKLAASAINTAVTDHIEAARMANRYIFQDIPAGKYSLNYGIDGEFAAGEKDIRTSVRQ